MSLSTATAATGIRSGAAISNQPYQTVPRGPLYSADYRLYFKDQSGRLVSPWHDIPLYANAEKKIFNMVVEIPRWTNAKMEMATKEPLNPIKQDIKSNQPRFVHNIFPHKGYIWNYGALPQTWEDPSHVDENTQAKGDNDPIDVVEVGSRVCQRGEIIQVKVLGCLALLDEGETDWKLLAIDVNDSLAANLNSISDVERHLPGLLPATVEWFRIYKRPAGKPNNTFGFNGNYKDAEFALRVIERTHEFWKQLIASESQDLNIESSVEYASHPADHEKWKDIVENAPAEGPEHEVPSELLDKWFFVSA